HDRPRTSPARAGRGTARPSQAGGSPGGIGGKPRCGRRRRAAAPVSRRRPAILSVAVTSSRRDAARFDHVDSCLDEAAEHLAHPARVVAFGDHLHRPALLTYPKAPVAVEAAHLLREVLGAIGDQDTLSLLELELDS